MHGVAASASSSFKFKLTNETERMTGKTSNTILNTSLLRWHLFLNAASMREVALHLISVMVVPKARQDFSSNLSNVGFERIHSVSRSMGMPRVSIVKFRTRASWKLI